MKEITLDMDELRRRRAEAAKWRQPPARPQAARTIDTSTAQAPALDEAQALTSAGSRAFTAEERQAFGEADEPDRWDQAG